MLRRAFAIVVLVCLASWIAAASSAAPPARAPAPPGLTTSAPATPAALAPEAGNAPPVTADELADRFERRLARLRVVLAALALGVFASGLRRRGAAPPARGGVLRHIALGILALLAFASNFNLFMHRGLHRHEFYHYYLGSKYFPELGYARLYECSVEAVRARDPRLAQQPTEITDLRIKRRRPAAQVMAAAPPCAPDFSPERWAAFQTDVASFVQWLGESGWVSVLADRGYNPSPVWTFVGRPLADRLGPARSELWQLATLDLVLLLASFGAIAWAFGFEAACLAAIVWGACGHTRYQWTGDAFLRQLWLASALMGLCLLKKRRPAAGGALLALSASLRVFPALLFAGPLVGELWRILSGRPPSAWGRRFFVGAALAAVLFVLGGTLASGRGPSVWREFAANTSALTDFIPRNALGLTHLLAFDPAPLPPHVIVAAGSPEDAIQMQKRRMLASRRWLQVALLALALGLFARAARPGRTDTGDETLEGWERVAMGALLVPLLMSPASYYLGYLAAAGLLATRRPRIGLACLAATLGCALAIAALGVDLLAFVASSALVIGFCFWTLVELQRAAPRQRVYLP